MKNNVGTSYLHQIKNLASLSKVYLSLAISFSSFAGYFIYTNDLSDRLLLVVSGVFFLSCGASSLNQYQERRTDAMMSRTSGRPIPSKQITPSQALVIATVFIMIGSILLYKLNPLCLILGLFNILWYNGVYTPLKYKSSFAVFAGSISGAVPPLIGYVAAGGTFYHPSILFVSLFMYLWQIPHFWLLLIRYKEDYKKAGIPVVTIKIPEYIFFKIIFIWIVATSMTSLFFPYFGIITKSSSVIALTGLNIGFIFLFFRIVFSNPGKQVIKTAFIVLNAFMILVLLVLILKF